MRYYGLLLLVLACLMASVFVEGQDLFRSEFFSISYAVMSLVLIIGSKRRESGNVDVAIGMLLLFSVAFLSTETLVGIMTDRATELLSFKVAIIVALDYCALGFLRLGRDMKHMERLSGDGRYRISG
ncbi:MAG: hypothetical protein JXC85_06410 [Candidatus Aenigmarchaeota archaeon]|nr:hypothetical protein [Candidatus Aenigmarchaeota archaeon]